MPSFYATCLQLSYDLMQPRSSIITAAVCTIALSCVLRSLNNAADGPFLMHISPVFWQCSTAAGISTRLLFDK